MVRQKQRMEGCKSELKKEANETNVAEQEIAILLHKQDVGKEIGSKVDREMAYFSDMLESNRRKLEDLLEENGLLKSFLKVTAFVKKGEGEEEIRFVDGKGNVEKVCKEVISKFHKMHLKISNLSDAFKDNQTLIKQKRKEFEEKSQKLREKEELLEKVTRPNNDFGTIMKSFIEESESGAKKGGYLLTGSKPLKKKVRLQMSFQDNFEEAEDKALKELNTINRRLLQMVIWIVTSSSTSAADF